MPKGPRINMVTAIRRTLEHELAVNPRVVVFGEDVGRKGGVHAATLGLQEKFGAARVFDTSLSEEGIIGRAVGMALAGLMPVPEIQFRKYADPADGAAQRLRHDALAHGEPLRRADGRAHARRLLQVRRSLAQPEQRSAVRARDRLARRDAVQRRGCGRPAALRRCAATIRRSSSSIARCSTAPGRAVRIPATNTSCRSARRGCCAPGTEADGRDVGRDGRALRAGGGRLRASMSSCSICAR